VLPSATRHWPIKLVLYQRVLMEKEGARNAAAGVEPVPAAAGQTEGQPQSAFSPPVPVDRNVLLQQALARSMQVDQPEEAAQPAAETTSTIASAKQDEEKEDMDEELHHALQMSMQDHGDTSAAPCRDMH